ncbi:MAG: DMT family transporter [Desulfurococcales archaeon]|nr:DMT family transporter [Desulfurococcales archaeon]
MRDYALLALAVVNVSSASVLVKLAGSQGVHGFSAASWRLLLSAILTWLMLAGRVSRLPGGRDLVLMLISGVGLALHFDLWMLSLSYTSVAVSVTIVDSYPALLAVAGRTLFREEYTRIQYIGAALAMAGVVLLSSQGGFRVEDLKGPLLAFGGMLGVAVYFIAGKELRKRYTTLEYTGIVYMIAALVSILLTRMIGARLTGYTLEAWIYLILLAIIPMLGGHSILNYLLKRLSLLATTVPVLGEPVGASILAYLILGEHVGLETAAFMAITLAGIGLTLLGEASRR